MGHTDHTRSIDSVLQVRDVLLVLLSVSLECLETSTQKTYLSLVVRQLLIITLTAFTLFHYSPVSVLQSTCIHTTYYTAST